jgi:hypothetical protein
VNTTYTWLSPTTSSSSLTGGVGNSQTTSITGTLNNSSNTTQTAVYTVVPTFGTCSAGNAGNSFTVTVYVNPQPVINTMSAVICTGTSFSLTPINGANGFVPAGTTYSWGVPSYNNASLSGGQSAAVGQSNIFGTLFNPTNTTYTATYTVIAATPNCGGTVFSVFVTINPKPAITPMSTTICNGVFAVTPTNGANGVVPVNTFYTWGIPTPSSSSLTGGIAGTGTSNITGTLSNSSNVTQTAVYLVTPSFGQCSGLTQSGNAFTVTVYVNPTPVINAINRTICTGSPFVITPTQGTDGFVPTGTQYTWGVPSYGNASMS